ncbi:MAG: helix-turn-helix domain-containing protein [Actinomycetota bacterium]|nr:helix-turn-helix domain-containing protein [Actinomycetota bacterium]MDQ3528868.1 helix-turn-helix domain-containing protein [Actinomycetota bacterium]
MEARDLVRLSAARAASRSGDARRLRVAAGLTQAEVAEVCGVTQGAVSHWEAGTRVPRGTAARRYARLLETLRRGVAA